MDYSFTFRKSIVYYLCRYKSHNSYKYGKEMTTNMGKKKESKLDTMLKQMRCDFTTECDAYLTNGWDKMSGEFGQGKSITYLIDCTDNECKEKGKRMFAIRVPGATRGTVFTDLDYKIENIHFDEYTSFGKLQCYLPKIVELDRIWKGKELFTK